MAKQVQAIVGTTALATAALAGYLFGSWYTIVLFHYFIENLLQGC